MEVEIKGTTNSNLSVTAFNAAKFGFFLAVGWNTHKALLDLLTAMISIWIAKKF